MTDELKIILVDGAVLVLFLLTLLFPNPPKGEPCEHDFDDFGSCRKCREDEWGQA